jgi:hypothetical protein
MAGVIQQRKPPVSKGSRRLLSEVAAKLGSNLSDISPFATTRFESRVLWTSSAPSLHRRSIAGKSCGIQIRDYQMHPIAGLIDTLCDLFEQTRSKVFDIRRRRRQELRCTAPTLP